MCYNGGNIYLMKLFLFPFSVHFQPFSVEQRRCFNEGPKPDPTPQAPILDAFEKGIAVAKETKDDETRKNVIQAAYQAKEDSVKALFGVDDVVKLPHPVQQELQKIKQTL